ncbi:hypothetical protein BpHYR1_013223, partial [Brachionus plicatilis]
MGLWDILKAITHQEQESGITKRIIKCIESSIAQITPCMNRCWCLINDNVLMSTFVAIITIMIMIMWTTILSYKRQKNNNFTFVCNNQNNNATSQLPTSLPVLSGTTAVSAAPTLSNRILTHQSRNYYQIQVPNAFNPNSDDIKDWIKNFDMFFKINNIQDNRKDIMFLKLDQECNKNVDEYPFSENDNQAYQQLKSLLIQLYERKENSDPKRSFLERRQLENENVHLFVTQLRILSKKAFPGVDQNLTDTFIADQLIDDTGVKRTIINQSIAKKLKLPTTPKSKQMFTAIGTPTNTIGKTTIKLTLGDQTLDTEVLVIGYLLNDCLIGLETLNKFNVTKDIIEQLIVRLKCTEIKEDEIDNDCAINFMEEREEPINNNDDLMINMLYDEVEQINTIHFQEINKPECHVEFATYVYQRIGPIRYFRILDGKERPDTVAFGDDGGRVPKYVGLHEAHPKHPTKMVSARQTTWSGENRGAVGGETDREESARRRSGVRRIRGDRSRGMTNRWGDPGKRHGFGHWSTEAGIGSRSDSKEEGEL